MYFVELYYSMVPSVFLSKAGTLSIFPHYSEWLNILVSIWLWSSVQKMPTLVEALGYFEIFVEFSDMLRHHNTTWISNLPSVVCYYACVVVWRVFS
jgi:hypothetical protein